MREREFREWLQAKGISTVNNRMSQLRTVEAALPALGSQDSDLDAAHRRDGLKSVLGRLNELARTVGPDEIVAGLLPNGSKSPGNRLRNLAAYVRNYRHFANGDPPGSASNEGGGTELTRDAIEAAMDECDRLGEQQFLSEFGFGMPTDYRVVRGGSTYPPKAVVGVAYKYLPGGRARTSDSLNGGFSTPQSACTILEELGFRVIRISDHSVAGVSKLDPRALEELKSRFIKEFPDFESAGGFGGESRYHQVGEGRRRSLINEVRSRLATAGTRDDYAIGAEILDIVANDASILGFPELRMKVANIRQRHPGRLEAATGTLIRDEGDPADAVTGFLDDAWPLIVEGTEANRPFRESRALPTVLQALARPTRAIAINDYQRYTNLGQALIGRSFFRNERLSAAEYREVLDIAFQIREVMEDTWDWRPRDLWDVQAFISFTCGVKLHGEDVRDADRIRQFALDQYIAPAREAGRPEVTILVREVNQRLGLREAWPNICQALQGPKFQALARVAKPERIGAPQSSATQFRFILDRADGKNMQPDSTNLILYGPPGTGKTYATAEEAVKLCDGSAPPDRAALMSRYRQLNEARQVRFVTFHQSYAYEDFVEGLRPVTGTEVTEEAGGDRAHGSAGFRLEARHGIFREICALAEEARKNSGRGGSFDLSGRRLFKMSLGRAGVEDHIFDAAIEGSYVVLGWGGEVDWSDPEFEDWAAILAKWREVKPEATGNDPNVTQMWTFRNAMREGDLVIVSEGNSQFRAIGELIGPYRYDPVGERDYNHRREVRWLLVTDESLPVETIYSKNFMMQSCYQLKQDRVNKDALMRLLPGAGAEGSGAPDQFVLVIDEINRANISKVFGELITLLEPDKRMGRPNALSVQLPYSGHTFGVPANLHIVGTMNTADRSIALLDTALRRRFEFREMMPRADLLTNVGGVDLGRLLTTINYRIEYLFDREHQIGHAYFMDCKTKDDLDQVMRAKVIPLLAEYFYEDWNKVAAVLGDADESEGDRSGGFLMRKALRPPTGLVSLDGATPHFRWTVRDGGFVYSQLQ